MGMNHALYLWIFFKHTKVHFDLAGRLVSAFQYISVQIHFHKHFLCHKTFGYACRSSPDRIISNLTCNISVIRCYKAAVVQSTPHIQDQATGLCI